MAKTAKYMAALLNFCPNCGQNMETTGNLTTVGLMIDTYRKGASLVKDDIFEKKIKIGYQTTTMRYIKKGKKPVTEKLPIFKTREAHRALCGLCGSVIPEDVLLNVFGRRITPEGILLVDGAQFTPSPPIPDTIAEKAPVEEKVKKPKGDST